MEFDLANGPEPQDTVLSVPSDILLQLAEQAEKRVDAIKAIMKATLRATEAKDWIRIGETLYLQATGASSIARVMYVSWQIDSKSKIYDDDKSGHYSYIFRGKFFFAGAEIDAFGMRSTRDDFFTGVKNPKKPQDIDERDVMQAAYTNCMNKGIKTILPSLRNVTPEMLTEAGIDISKIKGYGFNSSKGVEMSAEAQFQKSEIERMLRAGYGEQWIVGLKKHTAFEKKDGSRFEGHSDINKISEKQMPHTFKSVKSGYEKWLAKQKDNNQAGQPVTEGGSPDTASDPSVSKDNDLISDAQVKRMYTMSGGDNKLVKFVIGSHGYGSGKDVRKADYDAICDEITEMLRGDDHEGG